MNIMKDNYLHSEYIDMVIYSKDCRKSAESFMEKYQLKNRDEMHTLEELSLSIVNTESSKREEADKLNEIMSIRNYA